MLERDIQKQILEYLTLKGIVCKRNQSGMTIIKGKGKDRAIRMGEAGWPDLIGMTRHGTFFGIEVKQPGKKPTAIQAAVMERIKGSNGICFVATCLEDVIKMGF